MDTMTMIDLSRPGSGATAAVSQEPVVEHICTLPNAVGDGWGPDDPRTGNPRPCLACREHLRGAFGVAKQRFGSRFVPLVR